MVIGCGKAGGGYNSGCDDRLVMTHALAYRRHPDFSLIACVDPDRAARETFMRRWGVPHGFATLEEALDCGLDVDVASVAAPTPTHVDILRRLLNSPVRAVFAEKPLGGEPDKAADVLAGYAAAGKPLVVAYLRRFDPSMHMLRDEIARGEWGEIRSVLAVYGRGVMNNGSHMVDLLHFLTGEKPVVIAAITKVLADGVDGDPTVDATLQIENGPLIHLAGSDGRDYALFEVKLVCSEGVVDIEDAGLSMRRRRAIADALSPGLRRLEAGNAQPTQWGEAFLRALDSLSRALSTGDKLAGNGATALAAIRVCDSLRRAAA
jgi:predicted dehydrogenase